MNLILFIVLITLMALNYPVVEYLHKVNDNKHICDCSNTWMINYLYYYLLFWYATSALQIFGTLLLSNYFDKITNSGFYYPMAVVSGVSYSFYIIVLWAYIESLRQCKCSGIKNKRYIKTYSWFIFTLYIISVSYITLALSSIGKNEAKRRKSKHA